MEVSMFQVVAMGLVTVFAVLICLIVIISILGKILEKLTPKAAAPAPTAAPAAAPAPVAAAPAANKQQIVAAIAVAIAEEMGTDPSHIRIHSIADYGNIIMAASEQRRKIILCRSRGFSRHYWFYICTLSDHFYDHSGMRKHSVLTGDLVIRIGCYKYSPFTNLPASFLDISYSHFPGH